MNFVLLYLILINIIAFALMGIDKSKAKRDTWRISEKMLFLSAILGGSIGAWLGMYVFHHKTRHWYFVVGMPLILAVQILLVFSLTKFYVPYQTSTANNNSTVISVEQNTSNENDRKKDKHADSQETSKQLSLIMVGDILLHDRVEEAAVQTDGSYNYDAIFANTKDIIRDADLALVNQEVIIGGEELGVGGYPAFNASYKMADALVNAGFDVVCHGTNHALDRGGIGILNCIQNWETTHPQIGVLGIHNNQEDADNIYIVEKNGMKIAILNYTYGTNGISAPSDMPYAVDYLSEERVIADIDRAESQADFTIVCPHWGTEYYLGVDAMQKKWTSIFAEHGVDLVLGTHPHVIEPIEQVGDMLVYYSLGNFVNWTNDYGTGISNRMVGGMAQVTLEIDSTGNVKISDHSILPLISHVTSGTNGVTVYPLNAYTEELAEENAIRNQDSAFSLEYCKNLVQQIWNF